LFGYQGSTPSSATTSTTTSTPTTSTPTTPNIINQNINQYQQGGGGGGGLTTLTPYNVRSQNVPMKTDGVPGMDTRAINFKDAPVDFMLRENNPAVFDPLVNAKNFVQDGIASVGNQFNRFKDFAITPMMALANKRNALNPNAMNYNPDLQPQMDFLGGQTGTRITGTSDNLKFTDGQMMIGNDPNSGLAKYGPGSVLSGQNVVSGFGTNDYGLQLDKYIEKMMSYATRSKFQQAKLDRAIAEKKAYEDKIASEAAAKAKSDAAKIEAIRQQYAAQGRDYGQGGADAATQASYEGADGSYAGASTQDYGSGEKDGGIIGYKDGGKIDAKSFLDMIDVKASGSKSGKQQMQGAPKGITMDNESINAIVRADIPISEKIDILASYGYGKDRSKVEKDNEELFLGEGGYKDRNVGIGFNKDGEGIGGTMIYNIETGNPEYKIRFKKKFSKGGLATMFKLKG